MTQKLNFILSFSNQKAHVCDNQYIKTSKSLGQILSRCLDISQLQILFLLYIKHVQSNKYEKIIHLLGTSHSLSTQENMRRYNTLT